MGKKEREREREREGKKRGKVKLKEQEIERRNPERRHTMVNDRESRRSESTWYEGEMAA